MLTHIDNLMKKYPASFIAINDVYIYWDEKFKQYVVKNTAQQRLASAESLDKAAEYVARRQEERNN